MKEPFSFSFRSQHFDFFRNVKEHLPIFCSYILILFKRKKKYHLRFQVFHSITYNIILNFDQLKTSPICTKIAL